MEDKLIGEPEIRQFTQKQIKHVNIFVVLLGIIYEMYVLMSDDNTDITDGFFMLFPVFIAVCVKLRCGIYCFLPRLLLSVYYTVLQIVGLIMTKNLSAEKGVMVDMNEWNNHFNSVIFQFCIKILPVLIFIIVFGLFRDKVYRKIYTNRKSSVIFMSLYNLVADILLILFMWLLMYIVVHTLLKNEYTGFNPFTTLSASMGISAVILTGLTALFYGFRHKIVDDDD